jgi:glycosyltransferase involved in cell wall biosynthesis
MKRVLFFMHTSSHLGGVETWLDRIHAHLSEHGFEPVVGLVRGLRYNNPARYRSFHPDIRAVEVDGRGLDREGRVRALVRCIRRLKPDIVLPLGIVDANEAVIRCKQNGQDVRLLAHAQGNLAPMLADLATYRDWIDGVVCPGRLTRDVLIRWAGFAEDRVLNIANGADAASQARVERQGGGPLRVGYVGRLTQLDKRATDLIALHAELARRGVHCTLDIVGDGPCRKALETALGEFTPQVRIHGAVPTDSTPSVWWRTNRTDSRLPWATCPQPRLLSRGSLKTLRCWRACRASVLNGRSPFPGRVH